MEGKIKPITIEKEEVIAEDPKIQEAKEKAERKAAILKKNKEAIEKQLQEAKLKAETFIEKHNRELKEREVLRKYYQGKTEYQLLEDYCNKNTIEFYRCPHNWCGKILMDTKLFEKFLEFQANKRMLLMEGEAIVRNKILDINIGIGELYCFECNQKFDLILIKSYSLLQDQSKILLNLVDRIKKLENKPKPKPRNTKNNTIIKNTNEVDK